MKKFNFIQFCLLCLLVNPLSAQEDVIVLEGGIANGGVIEATINGDVDAQGNRNNPDRIYELKRGQFYMIHGKLDVQNPGGTLTIRAEAGAGPKPVIVRVPLNEVPTSDIEIEGSLTLQDLQYQSMQTDGALPVWTQFILKGDDCKLKVEGCLFEFVSGALFSANGAAPGFSAEIRNNYFRDFHDGSQWWGGRILNCMTPMDSLVFENNTTTGCGLTVLSQECMVAYGFINHNTFINNTKAPFMSQYWKEVYYTNNLFVNANWTGEDYENITSVPALDADPLVHGLVGLDTITLQQKIHPRYLVNNGSELGEEIDEISDYVWYAADNVCVSSATLDDYYAGVPDDGISGAPASYLQWSGFGSGPWKVNNVPGAFMNERTAQLVADWGNIKAENNRVYEFSAEDMGFGTDPLPQAAADVYIQWNRAQWEVPGVTIPDIQATYFGDYDANTVPGVETEDSYSGGITRISDMVEDFSYTMGLTSNIDGHPVGALHWRDIGYDPAASLEAVKRAYYDQISSITFQVDMSLIDDMEDGGKVWVNIGTGDDRYPMFDLNEDSIYNLQLDIPVDSVVSYTFSYQDGPDDMANVHVEAVPADCAGPEGTRSFVVPFEDRILPPYYFDSCVSGFYPVTKITVSEEQGRESVYADSVIRMVAEVFPETATDPTITWEVDNQVVATIDPYYGNLTGHYKGMVKVTARSNDGSGVSGEAWIEVILLLQEIIINNNQDISMAIGEEIQVAYEVDPAMATETGVSWSVEDPSIASINQEGQLSGLSCGTTSLTASALDVSGVSHSIRVRVMSNDANLASLEANHGNFTPPFHPETYVYVLELPQGSTYVNISAIPNHDSASVTGTGPVELSNGSGSANIRVVAEDGSEENYVIAIMVDATGMGQQKTGELELYPNPSTGQAILRLPTKGTWDISVLAPNGTEILRTSTVDPEVALDLGRFSPGIYIVKASSEKSSHKEKLILQ